MNVCPPKELMMLSPSEHIRNPLLEKRVYEARRQSVTLGRFADSVVAVDSHRFRSAKSSTLWATTQRTQVTLLRNNALGAITTENILEVLKSLSMAKSETAARLRGRIDWLLDASREALREGVNPAHWCGHSVNLLSKRRKFGRGHFAATPRRDEPRNPAGPYALRIADATAFSGLSRSTRYKLAAASLFATVKVAGRRVILRSDLEKFLLSKRSKQLNAIHLPGSDK